MNTSSIHLDSAKPQTLLAVCPAYHATPLVKKTVGGHPVWIKDETARMGLGAFKALGGVYAVAKMIAQKHGAELTPNEYLGDAFRKTASSMTFICASAGNHGLAVATGAQLFGARARIHLAESVPEDFANRLLAKGAEVMRSGAVYENSVAAAIKDAAKSGSYHLADGSWPGYIEPPRLVMEGYTILAEELREIFTKTGDWPSHVYLQAGVGGLAAAIAYMIRANWSIQPKIIVVEPDRAPCLKQSVVAGKVVTVQGALSNMSRLDCKVPSLLALDILARTADEFVTITDDQAAVAVQVSAKLGFETTPSGAAGLAALTAESTLPAAPLIVISEGAVADF